MSMKQEQNKLNFMVQAGVFAALTTLLTMLHIPVGSGYIHCGDAMIFLAALYLPAPYAAAAGAFGGMLADLISGYPLYALPTFLIKGLLALTFAAVCGKKPTVFRRGIALLLCGLISVAGYWVTAVILYGGWVAQFVETVPGNCVQAIGSTAVFAAVSAAAGRLTQTGKCGII